MNKGYQPKGKLGLGQRFGTVSGSVSSEYVKKGYSPAKAEAIGAAVAAKAGDNKFGKKKMAKMAVAGKK